MARHRAEPLSHIRDLTPDPANRRRHNPRNLGMLVDALQKVGASRSIVVDEDGVILAGNGVVEAASEAGITKLQIVEADGDTIVAVRRRGLTPAQKRELKVLLAGAEGVKAGLTDPDDVPADRPTGIVAGDLFELGAHRLLCGDCTVQGDVARLCGNLAPDLLFTDPPYGVAYQTKLSVEEAAVRHRRRDGLEVANDAMTPEATQAFVATALRVATEHLKPGGAFYVCSPGGDMELRFRLALVDASLTLRQAIAWVKDVFVMGRQDYHWRHETILYGWKDGAAHYFIDDRTQDTVWECARPKVSAEHPTMKPVELVARAIVNSSRTTEVVLDAFAGGGSTLIACEQTNRAGLALEIVPSYCQVIIDRWEAFTGQKATKVGEAVRA